MTAKTQLSEDAAVRRYEYDDGAVTVADFGPEREASVEVLDDTAIVVVGGEQYDLDVEGDARAFINNGVLTIEVDR